jgi:hypothetical protein
MRRPNQRRTFISNGFAKSCSVCRRTITLNSQEMRSATVAPLSAGKQILYEYTIHISSSSELYLSHRLLLACEASSHAHQKLSRTLPDAGTAQLMPCVRLRRPDSLVATWLTNENRRRQLSFSDPGPLGASPRGANLVVLENAFAEVSQRGSTPVNSPHGGQLGLARYLDPRLHIRPDSAGSPGFPGSPSS